MKDKIRPRYRLDLSQSIGRQTLSLRGVDDVDRWLRGNIDEINDWKLLDNADKAAEFIRLSCEIDDYPIGIVVDSDADGWTSAAIAYNYVNMAFGVEPIVLMHKGKQHGLADMAGSVLSSKVKLLIVPDAGSFDHDQQVELSEHGVDIVICDHHEGEPVESVDGVTVVNNQLCGYPNKQLSGAGVMWQVCRAIDEKNGTSFAESLTDLVAVGNISDMMDYREYETRAIVKNFFTEDNINNPFLKKLLDLNRYTLDKHGGYCYMGCAFAVSPFINAMCRSGTDVEKRTVFMSMLSGSENMTVKSKKRGFGNQPVPIVDEAVRLAVNVKARQAKEQSRMADELTPFAESCQGKAIVVADKGFNVNPELAGLVANVLQSRYGKPSFVLNWYDDEKVFRGSARDTEDGCGRLKSICSSMKFVDFASGHESAFGVQIPESKVGEFRRCLEKEYDSADYDVDFAISAKDVTVGMCRDLARYSRCWGQQLKPPKVLVYGVDVTGSDIALLSPDKAPTMKVKTSKLDFIKFRSSRGEVDDVSRKSSRECAGPVERVVMDCIGELQLNEWNGTARAQVIVSEYSLRRDYLF